MSEETKPAEKDSPEKKVLNYIQIVGAAMLILSNLAMLWVYKDRQDTDRARITTIENDRKAGMAGYELYKRERAAWEAQITSAVDQQKALNLKLEQHVSDKSIHVTEEQMRNLVVAQLQPITVAMGKMEVTQTSQQKQLDRVENLSSQILQLLQQKTIDRANTPDR